MAFGKFDCSIPSAMLEQEAQMFGLRDKVLTSMENRSPQQTQIREVISPLGKVCRAHQIAVALTRGATAFVECPDNKALATPAVAGCKHTFYIGGVFLVIGFDIGASVAFDRESIEQRLFRTKKAHGEQHQLSRPNLFGLRQFDRNKLPFIVSFPADLDEQN